MEKAAGTLSMRVMDFSGKTLKRLKIRTVLPKLASHCLKSFRLDELAEDPAKVSAGKTRTEVFLSTDRPAFFVAVEAEGMRGEFDDNAFTLLPGKVRKLTLASEAGKMDLGHFKKILKIRHLCATYR